MEKHIKKFKRIKDEMVKLNLDENNIDGWNINQLKDALFLKRRINDKPLPKRKKELIKLLVEWNMSYFAIRLIQCCIIFNFSRINYNA